MGLLSSYFRLRDMSDEMQQKSDVKSSLADMQSRLDQANAAMAAQAATPPQGGMK